MASCGAPGLKLVVWQMKTWRHIWVGVSQMASFFITQAKFGVVRVTLRVKMVMVESLWSACVDTSFRVGWVISALWRGGMCFSFGGRPAMAASTGGRVECDWLFIFLGGIVGMVVKANMVGTKCWVLTHGPKHSGAGKATTVNKNKKGCSMSCQL